MVRLALGCELRARSNRHVSHCVPDSFSHRCCTLANPSNRRSSGQKARRHRPERRHTECEGKRYRWGFLPIFHSVWKNDYRRIRGIGCFRSSQGARKRLSKCKSQVVLHRLFHLFFLHPALWSEPSSSHHRSSAFARGNRSLSSRSSAVPTAARLLVFTHQPLVLFASRSPAH